MQRLRGQLYGMTRLVCQIERASRKGFREDGRLRGGTLTMCAAYIYSNTHGLFALPSPFEMRVPGAIETTGRTARV